MKINFDAAKPIYEQVIELIKKMVVRGELEPGAKLPSQREMARKLEVNPNTVQRAYREMEVLQLVETKRGKGTFIKENNQIITNLKAEMAQEAVAGFVSEMNSLGFESSQIKKLVEKVLDGKKVKLEGK